MLQIEASQMNSLAQSAVQQRIAALAARVRNLNPELYAGVTEAQLLARTTAQVVDAERLGFTNQRDVARYIDIANKSPETVDPKNPVMTDPKKTPEERLRIASMKASMNQKTPNPGT